MRARLALLVLPLLLAGCAGQALTATSAPASGEPGGPASDEGAHDWFVRVEYVTVGDGDPARLLLREGDVLARAGAEWDASTPLAQELRLLLVARGDHVLADIEGPSPLALEADLAALLAGNAIEARLEVPMGALALDQQVRLVLELVPANATGPSER